MDTWHEKMAPFSPNKNNFHAFDRRRSHANVSCMHPYRWNCRYWLSDVLVVMFIVKLKIGQPMSKMTQYTFIPSRLTITSNNYANLRLDPQYWRSQHSDSSLAWRGKRIELAVVWITTTCLRSRQSIMKRQCGLSSSEYVRQCIYLIWRYPKYSPHLYLEHLPSLGAIVVLINLFEGAEEGGHQVYMV